MHLTDAQLELLARKLIETFAAPQPGRGFERYWPLAGAVEVFSESVRDRYEERVANALRNALEDVLRRTAPQSMHQEAAAVAFHLSAKSRRRKPWRPLRTYARSK